MNCLYIYCNFPYNTRGSVQRDIKFKNAHGEIACARRELKFERLLRLPSKGRSVVLHSDFYAYIFLDYFGIVLRFYYLFSLLKTVEN